MPLAGKTCVVLHAAWHSCGSYQVNVAQAAAYRALGAHVISWAVREWPPGPNDIAAPRWADYIAHTQDMPAHERCYSNMPRSVFAQPAFWTKLYWPLIHGDHARATAAMTDLAALPPALKGRRIDLVHCNHFFCLPAARKLGAPILCETQDIQALQYDLRNDNLFIVPPRATYDDLLRAELRLLRAADVCVHLNAEEDARFRELAPDLQHELCYPACPAAATGPGGGDIVIVASGNLPNILSVEWFLSEIWEKAGRPAVKIAGNVDAGLKARNPGLHGLHADKFLGRVDDLDAVYGAAGLVLLPTHEGHGLSIKSVEALATGAPLIATPQAFRGMKIDPARLSNVTLRADADSFAQALRAAASGVADDPRGKAAARAVSDTRRFYEACFSASAYASALWRIAAPLVDSNRRRP